MRMRIHRRLTNCKFFDLRIRGGLKLKFHMRPSKKYGIYINKYVYTEMFFCRKKYIMCEVNFNGDEK